MQLSKELLHGSHLPVGLHGICRCRQCLQCWPLKLVYYVCMIEFEAAFIDVMETEVNLWKSSWAYAMIFIIESYLFQIQCHLRARTFSYSSSLDNRSLHTEISPDSEWYYVLWMLRYSKFLQFYYDGYTKIVLQFIAADWWTLPVFTSKKVSS